MIFGKRVWKPLLQRMVTGSAKPYKMVRSLPQWPGNLINPGLYLHVPFCRNLCPFCPYNRIKYDESLFCAYEQAVKQEIDLYTPWLQGNIYSSLYIGGGTPTVNWHGLVSIIQHLRERIGNIGEICVELHPANMDENCLSALKDNGVTVLSIGVESTSDPLLKRIGRSHDATTAISAVERAIEMGFKSVNVDLMFALPGQTTEEWRRDVRTIVGLGADQLSTYPLFSFPYSERGKSKGISHVERPPHRTIRAMLEFTDQHCRENGSAYVSKLPSERPVAVSMPVNRRLEMAYWLYWRIYELKVTEDDFRSVFGPDASLSSTFGNLLIPLIPLGFLERHNGGYRVSKPGAYWIHRIQNEYSLNFIDHLWGTCRKEPWPKEVIL
jgi:hypothetical protein